MSIVDALDTDTGQNDAEQPNSDADNQNDYLDQHVHI